MMKELASDEVDFYYGSGASVWTKTKNISSLELCFNEAKELERAFIGVAIKIDGHLVPEFIINSRDNFESKLDYYKNTYDENLEHKYSPGVKILSFSYGNFVSNLYEDLLYYLKIDD